MTQNRKWLLLPPAVALLLVLGPLSMRTESSAAERTAANAPGRADQPADPAMPQAPAAQTPVAGDRTTPGLPRTPDLWQFGSTLVGVLLLGGVGLVVLRRLRRGPTAVGNGIVSLRQSLRLSQRQTVHAIEFEGRLLLVGEGERGLQLLHANAPPSAADDEEAVAAVAARLRQELDDRDEGAVPKNLVLPRPPRRTPAPAAPTARTAATARPAPVAKKHPFGDFRALLAKVGR